MKEKKTISLFLYNPESKQVVLSQRRDGQHFGGYLQATCHGAIEAGEDHADAMERELKEETGLDIIDIGPLEFLGELDGGARKKETCSYYLASITDERADTMHPTEEVSSFAVLDVDDVRAIVPHSRAKDADPKKRHVMFDDELEALTQALAIITE